MFAGKDVAGAAHVRGQLVNLVESPVGDLAAKFLITKIADGKIVGLGVGERREFQVDAAYPEAFPLETLDQVTANETTRAADQRTFRHHQIFLSTVFAPIA